MVEIIPFSISKFNQENYSLYQIFLDRVYLAAIAFPSAAAAFFCVLTRKISLYIEEIHCQVAKEQLENSKYPLQPSETPPFKQNKLLILKKQHFMVYKAIRQINRSLGFFLLIQFIKSLTGIINSLACIPIDSVDNKWFLIAITGLLVFRELLEILVVTSSANSIQCKVLKLTHYNTLTLDYLRFFFLGML